MWRSAIDIGSINSRRRAMTTWTAADAIDMLRASHVDFTGELTNIGAAYMDICDEIEALDGLADFTQDEFEEALREASDA
jgi:hypothetical protein